MVKYRILTDMERPVPRKRKRKFKWDIPIEDLEPGQAIQLDMDPIEVQEKVSAIRSFVAREQKRYDRRFSVYTNDQGVLIWRREDEGENDG